MSAEIVLVLRIITVLLIYSFLAVSLFLLWRVAFNPVKSKEDDKKLIELINRTDGSSLTFQQPEVYLGRDDKVDYQFSDESASNVHARIFMKEQNWWIEDLNSTNGTLLNNEKIVSPTRIFDQDQIQCGYTEILIVLANQPHSFTNL